MTVLQNTNDIAKLIARFDGDLPEFLRDYVSAQLAPAAFEDSTHEIWFITSNSETESVLKLCSCQRLQNRRFWRFLQSLFVWSFADNYQNLDRVYKFFAENGFYKVPNVKALSQRGNSKQWILCERVVGNDIAKPDRDMCHGLAIHLSKLHSVSVDGIGSQLMHTSALVGLESFKQCLSVLLQQDIYLQALKDNYSEEYQEIARQIEKLSSALIVPMVLDFRWDQLLHSEQDDVYLVDLDAAIFAPVEMEWAMLEVVLSEQELQWVLQTYNGNLPSLKNSRMLYRALFYAMGLLGDVDWKWWREQPKALDDLGR